MILILTPYSMNPLHPRLEYIEKYLTRHGYIVNKYNLNSKNKFFKKLNFLSLGFFQISAFFKSISVIKKHAKEIEIVFIQDLQYLHISIVAKIFKKKVIYETLDNNVSLKFYYLSNKLNFLCKLAFIKAAFSNIEKFFSKFFCDAIIVNSNALVDYFAPIKTNLIFYTSPFEINLKKICNNKIAFLYLGAFTKDKGADEILSFIKKYNYNIFIYGDASDVLLKEIYKLSNAQFKSRMSSNMLYEELEQLLCKYKLLGFSLIHSVHYSYESQEANKDIDYLSMGIPIIANHRKPTADKIKSGCGVFIDDLCNVEKILTDNNFYQKLSINCTNYYKTHYSQEIFEKKLLRNIENIYSYNCTK